MIEQWGFGPWEQKGSSSRRRGTTVQVEDEGGEVTWLLCGVRRSLYRLALQCPRLWGLQRLLQVSSTLWICCDCSAHWDRRSGSGGDFCHIPGSEPDPCTNGNKNKVQPVLGIRIRDPWSGAFLTLDPGWEKIRIWDPGFGNEHLGSHFLEHKTNFMG